MSSSAATHTRQTHRTKAPLVSTRQFTDLCENVTLDSKTVGALPIINHYMERLGLGDLLDRRVPSSKRQKLSHRDTLMVLIRNIMVEREPLYEIAEWAALYDPHHVGLNGTSLRAIGDDRIGRSLDALFLADRASMMTEFAIKMVATFSIDLSQLHNDSTSVTVTGDYKAPAVLDGKSSVKIKHGHNKDYRPDLKQLLFTLTVSRDGAVPVHFRAYDGNVTDDTTHVQTWDAVRRIAGNGNFTYVADSKLCTRTQMDHIQREGGRFITVMPKTRSEDRAFRQHLRISNRRPVWHELLRKPKGTLLLDRDDDIYWGVEAPSPSAEGYRIIWILSSQKRSHDAQARQRKIEKTIAQLDVLKEKVGKRLLKSKEQVHDAVSRVLRDNESERWFDWQLMGTEVETFKQSGKGRPGKDTKYERQVSLQWTFTALPSQIRIQDDAIDDGIFPLITNHPQTELNAREVLAKYKYQPFIEKRHEQMKTVFDVAPVNFKLPYRIEALMFIYFVILAINALIERDIRRAMKAQSTESLPLYPEARRCRNPTTERIITLFRGQRRHILKRHGQEVKTFVDDLSPVHRTVLELLEVPPSAYEQ
jgi:transposase